MCIMSSVFEFDCHALEKKYIENDPLDEAKKRHYLITGDIEREDSEDSFLTKFEVLDSR